MTISITSQQNVFEEKKVIEQFQLFTFGTEVLISLISSLVDGGGVGGWYSWQKEPLAAHWFFLFQIKKGTSKLTKIAILRKKGTIGSQWQSLINSRTFIYEDVMIGLVVKMTHFRQCVAGLEESMNFVLP